MKRIFLLGILTASISGSTFCQSDEVSKSIAVKINPLPFLIDNNSNESYYLFSTALRIHAERSISKNKSLVAELGYAGPVTFDIENGEAGENIATKGILAGLGIKFYLQPGSVMSEAYLMPMINFSDIKLLEHPEGLPRTGCVGFKDIGASVALGFQKTYGKNWVVDFHAGAGIFSRNYYDNTYMESPAVIDHNEIGIKPVIGISIGKFL